MQVAATTISTETDLGMHNLGGGIIGERWPTLGRAMSRYQQGTAERFSQLAYERVEAGLIRLDCRRVLAAAAEVLGIKQFDAQLLIACAVRQWSLDHRYDARPSRKAPALSIEYKLWRRAWMRAAIVIGTVVALDGIIVWKWLG